MEPFENQCIKDLSFQDSITSQLIMHVANPISSQLIKFLITVFFSFTFLKIDALILTYLHEGNLLICWKLTFDLPSL
jgi:hypothetical protein